MSCGINEPYRIMHATRPLCQTHADLHQDSFWFVVIATAASNQTAGLYPAFRNSDASARSLQQHVHVILVRHTLAPRIRCKRAQPHGGLLITVDAITMHSGPDTYNGRRLEWFVKGRSPRQSALYCVSLWITVCGPADNLP